ncbi:hypothetical protein LXL04_019702 [Taraxacum kok-saghyz]
MVSFPINTTKRFHLFVFISANHTGNNFFDRLCKKLSHQFLQFIISKIISKWSDRDGVFRLKTVSIGTPPSDLRTTPPSYLTAR